MNPSGTNLQTLGRRLRLGRWLYLLWHQPRAALARSRREGGPWQQWLDRRGREAMRAAARELPPLPAAGPDDPEVWFLTGRRFWYQTAFCCWSLRTQAGRTLRPIFVDDGSFDAGLHEEASRLFPGSQVHDVAAITQQLDAALPAASVPALRGQRERYLHLRKLTDVHAGRQGWRLVLDSDMLFFRRPNVLLAWLKHPDRPIHMVDVRDSYGYPDATLTALAGRPLPVHLNVGICGLQSDAIDWPQLEAWCAELLRRHGSSYYLEQALVALWMTRLSPLRLPASDYRLMPDEAECFSPTAVLHHYVDLSKRGYFRHAWRRVAASARQ